MTLGPLIDANLAQLAVARELVGRIPGEALVTVHPVLFPHGGVGGHFRHVLDYYAGFLGAADGRVDYDARPRDVNAEREPDVILARIEVATRGLRALTADLPLMVRDNGRGLDEDFVPSSRRRELAFLLSHSVHHFALVGMLLKVQGHDTPPTFGVAPSTLRAWSERAPLAAGG